MLSEALSDQTTEVSAAQIQMMTRRLLLFAVVVLLLVAHRVMQSAPAAEQEYEPVPEGPAISSEELRSWLEKHRLFDRASVHSCKIYTGTVKWWVGRWDLLGATEADIERLRLKSSVSHAASLPYLYASAECLFDKDGNPVAYTVMGESLSIETTLGRYPGDDIRFLGDALVLRLLAGGN